MTFVPLIFQEICSKNERYSSKTYWFRFSHFRVGTPQFSRIDKALQSSWSHFGTWMVPSMWCLEHRLYYFWASSSKYKFLSLFIIDSWIFLFSSGLYKSLSTLDIQLLSFNSLFCHLKGWIQVQTYICDRSLDVITLHHSFLILNGRFGHNVVINKLRDLNIGQGTTLKFHTEAKWWFDHFKILWNSLK